MKLSPMTWYFTILMLGTSAAVAYLRMQPPPPPPPPPPIAIICFPGPPPFTPRADPVPMAFPADEDDPSSWTLVSGSLPATLSATIAAGTEFWHPVPSVPCMIDGRIFFKPSSVAGLKLGLADGSEVTLEVKASAEPPSCWSTTSHALTVYLADANTTSSLAASSIHCGGEDPGNYFRLVILEGRLDLGQKVRLPSPVVRFGFHCREGGASYFESELRTIEADEVVAAYGYFW